MSLFQQSVLRQYTGHFNKDDLANKYQLFKNHFHNPEIQENILNAKEEEYQEGFVRDLFVNVLGYTLNPQPNYNFVLEKKTEADSTKSDGAIIKSGKVVGILELKDTYTTDLGKVEKQAFGYKHRHPDCTYVITSNFQKLRFYINDAVEFIEFNLFTLTEEEFELLYTCLEYQNIFKDLPALIKRSSLSQEASITKKLYADYSQFKRDLFNNIVAQNPQYNKLELFKKTQKLLDRFLFILFAEDRVLVPPNSVREIIKQWETLKELDSYEPLFNRFRKYFGYLNTGHEGKHHEIFAYNGGLFAPDEILDSISIDDKILFAGTKKLSDYDFESEVDVNILGHIFEHSLTEIEEVQAELEGTAVEKAKTKRKKDGVFYTPRYITKYIVENTVGELCRLKKEELNITDDEFAYRKIKKSRESKLKKLDDYRSWLFQLTICDPACGSGAFLNQALEFLIAEHGYIDELKSKLFGDAMTLSDVESTILENNLFGVDINEEAVEIAKLSLWLRTAQKGRKLNDLSKNIKCGNSLIDDPAIAGDKAFNWQQEFKSIFENGGFDIIIGNPPYLRVQGLRENFEKESLFYEHYYKTATGRFDIYVLFIEKGIGLIKANGQVSFILPHKFMISDFGIGVRDLLISNKNLYSIISFGSEMVFEEASTYTCIIKCTTQNKEILYSQIKPIQLFDSIQPEIIPYSILSKEKWNMQSKEGNNLFRKLNSQPYKAKDIFENISQGAVSVGDELFLLKGKIFQDKFFGFSEKTGNHVELEALLMKPLLKGDDVKKYEPPLASYYIIYPHFEKNGKTYPYEEDDMRQKFPLAYSYFLPFKEELIEKKIRYKTNPRCWYSLHRSREISLFEQEKLVTPETSFGTNMSIDLNCLYHNTQIYSFIKKRDLNIDYKFLLSILNSTLLWFYLKNTGNILRGGFFRFKTSFLEPFPIPDYNNIDQLPFIQKADIMLSKNKELQETKQQILKLLQVKYENVTITKKLQDWPSLDFKDFLKELTKQKIKISLAEQTEWMQHFETEKAKANAIQELISATDKEIDQMVYTLYGLTKEEIKIVEGL
ncbi:MAG: N-6 DNA methylase [Chitinophagaceae bacterium]|nr:N-6 DNA methylase [Chitinophagaceae bacterium]